MRTTLKLTGQQKPGKGLDYEKTIGGFFWYGPADCWVLFWETRVGTRVAAAIERVAR
jgi:hypothetical protein